jgi:hypothetical protein
MNSYINLILEAEGAKERLRRLFQSAPEPEKNDQPLESVPVRRQRHRQKRRRSVGSGTMSPSGDIDPLAVRTSWATQCDTAPTRRAGFIGWHIL